MPTNNKSTEAEQTLESIDGHRQIYQPPRGCAYQISPLFDAGMRKASPICEQARAVPPDTVLAPPRYGGPLPDGWCPLMRQPDEALGRHPESG